MTTGMCAPAGVAVNRLRLRRGPSGDTASPLEAIAEALVVEVDLRRSIREDLAKLPEIGQVDQKPGDVEIFMCAMTIRQLADRQVLAPSVPSDLLEQFHA